MQDEPQASVILVKGGRFMQSEEKPEYWAFGILKVRTTGLENHPV